MDGTIKKRELENLEHSVRIKKFIALILFIINLLFAYGVIASVIVGKLKIT